MLGAIVFGKDERRTAVAAIAVGAIPGHDLNGPSSQQKEIGGQTIEQMEFSFRPSGALTGRSVSLVLADGQKQQTVVVTGTTGAVSVQ